MANFSGNFCNSENGKVLSSFYSHNDLSHHGGFQGHSIFQMNEIDHRFYGRDIQNDSFNFRRDLYADLAATKAAYSLSGCHPQFVNSIASTTNMYGMGPAASNMYGMGGTTSNIYSMSAFGLEGRYSSYSNVSSGSSHNRGHFDGGSGTGAVDSENNARDFTSLCEEEKHCSFANGENMQSEGTFCKNYNSSYVSDQRRCNVIEEEDVKHPVTDENIQSNPTNDKLFFCKLCGKNITVVNSFEKSMADHAKLYHGSIYFCLFCDKSYKWKKSLDKHLVKFHPHSTPFNCELCGKEFRNNYSLSDHKNSHCNLETKFTGNMHQARGSFSNPYQEKCFTCPLCSGSFITKDSLRKHIKCIHLTESIHDCEICGKECKDEINTDREFENRDFPLMCEVCKKCFCSLSTLNKHKQAVHSLGKPECDICGKDFASFDIMKRHMLLHSDEVRYLCEVCGKTFVRLDRFNKHMKRHMGDRPFQCVTCQKTFRDKYILNLHSRKHTGERPFLCNICGKSFSSKSTLRIHISRHTGDSQYKCDICNKTFAYSTYRTAHMRIHTNEKPFKCSICSKEFTQKCSLNFHMLRHSGEKKHTCTICKKAFLHSSYLNIHMRTHTGEKPYKCSSCNKEFSQKSTLNTHKRKCP
ncbi:oocyte zinc finger protein XlCOF6-like isoform X1 [Macrobrachium nipponense]|uniref:oocyte zinc finger protein XlCOF6-like isoform X1 n=1 Tax=Macrobrachium nipponense TaxID=159736 RepID=UPI0030C81512